MRACDRLTQQASRRKVRIKDLVRQLMPMTPLAGDLGKADRRCWNTMLARGHC